MPDDRINRELLLDAIGSQGWRYAFVTIYAPILRRWRMSLLNNPDLSEGQRKGYVYALAAFREGIYTAYKNASLEIPSWLMRELDPFVEE